MCIPGAADLLQGMRPEEVTSPPKCDVSLERGQLQICYGRYDFRVLPSPNLRQPQLRPRGTIERYESLPLLLRWGSSWIEPINLRGHDEIALG